MAQPLAGHDIDAPLLSLVIPAFNERARLPRTLRILRRYLHDQSYAVEVIVVDDGSTDGTADLVARRASRWPALRLIGTQHRGKGHAVRTGLLAVHGRYTFLCDADLSMPITELPRFLPPILPDVEVAFASREGPHAHRYGEPLPRHLMGRAFNAVVRALALPGIQDSQCGFKCIRSDIAWRLAGALTIDGWGFDVEMLYLARRWGYRAVEIPIEWYYSPSSRIHPLRDSWTMTRDVWQVRRNARAGLYDRSPDWTTQVQPDRIGEPAPARVEP
ncbi:MAG TPA: dolichyl-phosphate beta-glucosyltransferase [Ktedonobacterales bacterium]|jgi:dolichyl-phosphate beta-glucosyltransferase|nr:dolichyl-phosphate beta-glucosyltransferase [Ktedonobacterales bacterium]